MALNHAGQGSRRRRFIYSLGKYLLCVDAQEVVITFPFDEVGQHYIRRKVSPKRFRRFNRPMLFRYRFSQGCMRDKGKQLRPFLFQFL
ncbi:MAG: hypothetical protein J5I98_26425 [Phaeodactylibacter sp.]|nr:hypothetical protein [Phaeodactylibacter sp.]